MKNFRKNSLLFIVSTVLALLSVEFILRAGGYRPWRPAKLNVVVEPRGEMYTSHPTLGYTHLPGTFKVILPTSFSFKVTHSSDGLRATHPVSTNHVEHSKDEIWIFGCSFTYGWTLNDKETYPWLLQKNLPDYEVINFGVNGFGTVHSFLQFREALEKRKKPKLVIITYASFHDPRNTLVRIRNKGLVLHGAVLESSKLHRLVQPYARLNGNGEPIYSMSTAEFNEFPFMRQSAFMHALEKVYNSVEVRRCRSHEVSKAIIKEFSDLCKKKGIDHIVAGIFRDALTTDVLEYSRGEGIPTTDISVDLNKRKNRNLPHDSHPSAIANKTYARKIKSFLDSKFLRSSQSQY